MPLPHPLIQEVGTCPGGGAVCRQGQLHQLVASEGRPGAAGPPPAKEMHSFRWFCMQGGSEAAQSNTHLEVSTVACVQGLEEPFRAGHGAAHLPPWPVGQRVRSPPTAHLLHMSQVPRGSPGISLISQPQFPDLQATREEVWKGQSSGLAASDP